MNELRWILLAAGILLIVGLYVWGVRAKRRSATPDLDGIRRVEPASPASTTIARPVGEPIVRREPRLSLDEEVPADVAASDLAPEIPEADAFAPPPPERPRAERSMRTEPTISAAPETAAVDNAPPVSTPSASPAPTPRAPQKIVSVRIAAPMPSRFEGVRLREALDRNGLRHGRFDIFHRLAADGRPIISLASVVEPGTFDPKAMDQAAYPGVALFTVLPGPVSALDALEDLLVTSRALAMQLGGTVLDDKGVPLSLQRIAHIRDDVLAFERTTRAAEATG
jgi:cell division protein ZipA